MFTAKSVSFDETATVYVYRAEFGCDNTMMVEIGLNNEVQSIINRSVEHYLQREENHNTLSSLENERLDIFENEYHQETNLSAMEPTGSARSGQTARKTEGEAHPAILVTDMAWTEHSYDNYITEDEECQYGLDSIFKQALSFMMPCISVGVMFLLATIWWSVNHYKSVKRLWRMYWCFMKSCHFCTFWNIMHGSLSYLKQRQLPGRRKYRETRREIGEEDARTRPKEICYFSKSKKEIERMTDVRSTCIDVLNNADVGTRDDKTARMTKSGSMVKRTLSVLFEL
jgi:hypothetical protein